MKRQPGTKLTKSTGQKSIKQASSAAKSSTSGAKSKAKSTPSAKTAGNPAKAAQHAAAPPLKIARGRVNGQRSIKEEIVRARIDPEIKLRAEENLAAMGLDMSTAIRLLFTSVADTGRFPLEIKVPTAKTQSAMREADEGRGTRHSSLNALFAALEI